MTTRLLPLLLGLLTSCYNPDFSQTYLRCDAQNANRCPDGKSCVAGYCGPPFPTSTSAPDARPQAPADMSDPPDMGPWTGVQRADLTACAISVSGGNGYLLRPKVAACPSFGGALRSTCKAPWALCGSWFMTREECASLPWGFFSMSANGLLNSAPPPADGSCNAWGNPATGVRTLFGCGTSKSAPTFDVNGTCRNYYRMVPVASRAGQPTSWWTSPATSDPSYAQPSHPDDGALCCLP